MNCWNCPLLITITSELGDWKLPCEFLLILSRETRVDIAFEVDDPQRGLAQINDS